MAGMGASLCKRADAKGGTGRTCGGCMGHAAFGLVAGKGAGRLPSLSLACHGVGAALMFSRYGGADRHIRRRHPPWRGWAQPLCKRADAKGGIHRHCGGCTRHAAFGLSCGVGGRSPNLSLACHGVSAALMPSRYGSADRLWHRCPHGAGGHSLYARGLMPRAAWIATAAAA